MYMESTRDSLEVQVMPLYLLIIIHDSLLQKNSKHHSMENKASHNPALYFTSLMPCYCVHKQ